MAKHVAFNKPSMDADITVPGLKILIPPKLQFKVEVEFDDKIFKKIKDDSIILDEMNGAAQEVYKQTAASIKSKLSAFEKLAQVMVEKNAPEAEFKKQVDGLNKSIEQDKKIAELAAQKAVTAVWTTYAKKNKDYLKYKIKIVVTVVGAAAGLATSIALMATAPFTGGASSAFAIIGMFKSAVTITKEIASAWMEVETAQKILQKQLAYVETAAKNIVSRKLNEYSATVVNQFLGISQPSIKNCIGQISTVKNKLTGIEKKTHDASKLLNGILDKQEQLKTEFMKQAKAQLAKHPSAKAKDDIKTIEKRLDALLDSNADAVQEQIAKVMKLHERFKAAEKTTAELEKRVAAMAKFRTLDHKILDNIIILVDVPLGALDGNGAVSAATDIAKNLVPPIAALAYDKISGKVLDGTILA